MQRIAVIGAGPAGGAAALELARAGAEVLFYASPKGGEKPCGGGLPGHLLPRLEGFDPSRLPAAEPAVGRFVNGAGWRLRLDLKGLKIFRRGDLDPALAAAAVAAGARRIAERVEGLEWQGGRPVLKAGGKRQAVDAVIAADGARGIIRRTLEAELGDLFAPQGESVGLGASLGGVEHGELVVELPGVADAYGWIFPRPGGVSVGLAYTPGALSHGAARSLLASFLGRNLPAAAPRRPGYRYPIPVYGPWTLPAVRAAAARGVLLAGDAAALADPLTREGIRYAVFSGQWAAASLLEGNPAAYPVRLADHLDGELSRARRACQLFYEAGIAQGMVPVCRLHPGIAGVLADLLACRQPYRGLRRRLLRAACFLPPARAPLGAAASEAG